MMPPRSWPPTTSQISGLFSIAAHLLPGEKCH
eukprot:CAMPEP_0171152232 /NCGR_PEP_ID=MMETSP0766_2-20121228/150465_1 /TAXON_ID=439317 /ORGANISM="Gambierdiscus australes, Strain CAWD 149" /LENGTH=31 /DNA_ID= /DNA_START= /DNA_END= /DNA_ORIENTATION=